MDPRLGQFDIIIEEFTTPVGQPGPGDSGGLGDSAVGRFSSWAIQQLGRE